MKHILTIVVVVAALMSPTLYAGAAATWMVSIEFDAPHSEVASGLMWTARSSDDDVQGIRCSYKGHAEPVQDDLSPWDHAVNNWAWCQARDADGGHVICFTGNRHLLDALQSISPFSHIRFVFANARDVPDIGLVGECMRPDFSTQSLHLPEFRIKKKQAMVTGTLNPGHALHADPGGAIARGDSDFAATNPWPGVAAAGDGTVQTHVVYGQLPAGQDVPIDSHRDVVTITVHY